MKRRDSHVVSQGGDEAQDGVVNKASAEAQSRAAHRARAGRSVSLHPRCLSCVIWITFDITAAF